MHAQKLTRHAVDYMNYLHHFVCIRFIRTVVKLRAAPDGPSLLADIVVCHFDVIVSTDKDAAINAQGSRVLVGLTVVNFLHVIMHNFFATGCTVVR